MFHGELVGIFVHRGKAEALLSVDQVEVVKGRGLIGDRYCLKEEAATGGDGADREVTLIEAEALEGLARESRITLEPWQARRNLLTRGVPLNHLVGRTFAVGPVVLRGIRLCEPCDHLQSLTCDGVRPGLMHRGGLRAEVIQGGTLNVGAVISPS
jgi:MOSC domain-containing protein YiiM